jgi:hypothetical protein
MTYSAFQECLDFNLQTFSSFVLSTLNNMTDEEFNKIPTLHLTTLEKQLIKKNGHVFSVSKPNLSDGFVVVYSLGGSVFRISGKDSIDDFNKRTAEKYVSALSSADNQRNQ